jgi:pyridinium-3,5-bisthiocarboxylic acid mononucleotide nickel chelatase
VAEQMVVLETNIDDMNPELYAGVSQALFAAGARDVWLTPIQMKKDRPAVQLSVLAPATHEAALVTTLLRETTTLGVRSQPVTRYAAERTTQRVTTAFGDVMVKVKWIDGQAVGAKPEHDECVRLAEAHGIPVRMVYEAAAAAAYTTLLAPAAVVRN